MMATEDHADNTFVADQGSLLRGLLAPGRRKAFALAGNATLTVRSARTGQRFTYKVTARSRLYFVGVLTGADNTRDYRYLGTIFSNGFRLTAKSKINADAPSAIAFTWLAQNWESERVEIWHEGFCGRCGRKLTVPESIESGIGPVCAEK